MPRTTTHRLTALVATAALGTALAGCQVEVTPSQTQATGTASSPAVTPMPPVPTPDPPGQPANPPANQPQPGGQTSAPQQQPSTACPTFDGVFPLCSQQTGDGWEGPVTPADGGALDAYGGYDDWVHIFFNSNGTVSWYEWGPNTQPSSGQPTLYLGRWTASGNTVTVTFNDKTATRAKTNPVTLTYQRTQQFPGSSHEWYTGDFAMLTLPSGSVAVYHQFIR